MVSSILQLINRILPGAEQTWAVLLCSIYLKRAAPRGARVCCCVRCGEPFGTQLGIIRQSLFSSPQPGWKPMSSPGWGRAINRALPAGPQVQVSLAPGVAEPFQQFVTAGPAPVAEARASSVAVGLLPDARHPRSALARPHAPHGPGNSPAPRNQHLHNEE